MGGEFRVSNMVRPFLGFLSPEVQSADRKTPSREKIIYTAISVFIFIHLPLYGMYSTSGPDPFHWIRVILASDRGTLMELGIAPIVTSVLLINLLVASKIIHVDINSRHDRELLNRAQKILGTLIALGEAIAYVVFGMFGSVEKLGLGNALLLILQLFLAGIFVLRVDEILRRDNRFGPEIDIFVATDRRPRVVQGRQWGRRFGVPLEPNEFARALERIRTRRRRDRAARRHLASD